MSFLATATRQGKLAPKGSHEAKLVSAKETKGAFGNAAVAWTFRVQSGDHAGCEIVKTTGTANREGNACGQMLDDLHGKPYQLDEIPNEAELMRQVYLIEVDHGADGTGSVLVAVKPKVGSAAPVASS